MDSHDVDINGLFGVEVIFEDTRFTAIACPQYSERLANVQGVRTLLNKSQAIRRL